MNSRVRIAGASTALAALIAAAGPQMAVAQVDPNCVPGATENPCPLPPAAETADPAPDAAPVPAETPPATAEAPEPTPPATPAPAEAAETAPAPVTPPPVATPPAAEAPAQAAETATDNPAPEAVSTEAGAEAEAEVTATETPTEQPAEEPVTGAAADEAAPDPSAAPKTTTAAPAADTAPEAETADPAPATAEASAPETATADAEGRASADVGATADGADASADTEVAAATKADVEAGEAVTVTAVAEGEAEAVESAEVTVTEDTARSSDEEFRAPAQGGGGNKGLSNFEKFALGVAGLVVLDQILDANERVVVNTGDRVVVRRDDGHYYVLRDDDVLLRRPGAVVKTETFRDGSTRTTVTRRNGVKVVTIAAADGRVLRRDKILPDGTVIILFDDTRHYDPVDWARLPEGPRYERVSYRNPDAVREVLHARAPKVDRAYSLAQIREIEQVRYLLPEITVDAINFDTGSAAIRPDEARTLAELGQAMADLIAENPAEMFLIEGHTDATGNAADNMALSDRRAESLALALAEYYDVPPENMVIQGYGETDLLVETESAEPANRRAVVRRITPLMVTASN